MDENAKKEAERAKGRPGGSKRPVAKGYPVAQPADGCGNEAYPEVNLTLEDFEQFNGNHQRRCSRTGR